MGIDKEKCKKEIENILMLYGRTGIVFLLEYMEKNGFYDAPCSSKYHLCVEGGLAQHTLNVYEAALKIAEALNVKDELMATGSLAIVCICHDLGKMGDYGKPMYVIDEELPFPEYSYNKELSNIPHEIRSVKIAERFIALTEDEEWAILCHNGLYGPMAKNIGNHESQLYMILHWADMWASRVMETEKADKDSAEK